MVLAVCGKQAKGIWGIERHSIQYVFWLPVSAGNKTLKIVKIKTR